jgi:hypothetical protein
MPEQTAGTEKKLPYIWKLEEPQYNKIFNDKVIRKSSHKTMQMLIASVTACGFFILLGIPLLYLLIGVINVNDTIELIKTIAAILGGVVGMVWGFYFYTEKA